MLNVRTRVVLSRAVPTDELAVRFSALLDDLGQDMADQVRLNIVRFGKPGGDGGWPPVSGWKQAAPAAHDRAARAHSAAAARSTGGQAQSHRNAAARERAAARDARRRANPEIANRERQAKEARQRAAAGGPDAARHKAKAAEHTAAARAMKRVLDHSAYARRKEEGKTPGQGRFHADELLRDTEALFASLTYQREDRGQARVISLFADGTAPGRSITNQRLLEVHALGEGDMPQRDPTSDMTNYEARVQRRLDAFWDAVFLGKGQVTAEHARGGSQSAPRK